MPTYVVGVDSTPPSLAALRWTQDLARRTGADVKVVAVWFVPPTDDVGLAYAVDPLEEAAVAMLERSLAEVPADGVSRSGVTIVQGSVARGLLDAASDADLLVVGIRAHSDFERIIGSVAVQCAQHAPCPFVAVPESAPAPGDLVSVAYDGSESADTALRWAASVTSGDDLRLRIITVWEKNQWTGSRVLAGDPVSPDDRAVEELEATVARVLPDVANDVDYCPVFGPGKVTPHLVDAAEGSSLLVVGSRGRGGFTGLLLGSVSQRCLESSPIPVAVIRN